MAKSCATNLLEFLEYLTKSVDEGNSIDILYLDFAKAFDKVPHKRLLAKIKALISMVTCSNGLKTGSLDVGRELS